MHVRVVTYAPDPTTSDVATRIAARFSLPLTSIRCPRHAGPMGRVRRSQDARRGALPEIELSEPVGPVDALIVGAPLSRGRLAAPMRRFLEHPARIPPVIGVFATCRRRWPAPGFDDDVALLANALGGPETVILAGRDGGRRALDAFLDRLAPILRMSLAPVVLPRLAA